MSHAHVRYQGPRWCTALCCCTALLTIPVPGTVQAAEDPQPSTATVITDGGQQVQQELEQLRQLRQQDPERFRQEVAARKEALRQQLRTLKQEHPEAFRQLMARIRDQRRRRLEELRTTDPERYRAVMQQRQTRVQERLQRLQQENPQRYDAVRQRVSERRQQFLRQHPGWTDHPGRDETPTPPSTRRRADDEHPAGPR